MKNNDQTDRLLRVLITILTYAFLSAVVYIPFMGQIGHMSESVIIRSYYEDIEEENCGERQSAKFLSADEYNRRVVAAQARSPFFYRGSSEETDSYRAILQGSGGVMCIIEIPSVDICLPVGHGTSDEVLETMAGHVYGTSLPVGGISTNSVIAAHSGSASSRLFTDLGRIAPGDRIFVHILSRVLTYTVLSDDDISVVLPYDGETQHADSYDYDVPYFRIKPGEDILTLYTCTPPGINSHRLIVQAHREKSAEKDTRDRELRPSVRKAGSLAACLLLAPIPLLGSLLMFRRIS